jgi:gliding motility-associated-like protein
MDSFSLKVNVDDTIYVSDNSFAVIQLYDTVDNPMADQICFTDSQAYVVTTWNYTPSSWVTQEQCETYLYVQPQDTGWFYFDVQVVLYIPCDSDTFYVSDSVYIVPMPSPGAPPIQVQMIGSEYFCPGGSVVQYGTGGGAFYTWSGPTNNGVINDSIIVSVQGWYTVASVVYDTNQYGCIDSAMSSMTKLIKKKPQPVLEASSLVICPNDVVWLNATSTGATMGFFWEGPSGPIPGDSSAIAVSEPGAYYVIVNDSDSCDLSSNTIILNQYTTPSLAAGGDLIICDGDSVTLSVVSNAGSQIEWLPPLSGSGTEQTVYSPGVYTCKITSCGIETYATMEVFPSYVESEITFEGVLCLDSFMVLYGSDSMHTYAWNQNNTGADSIIITQAGTYVLTTTDTNGCSKVSDPVQISIDQDPPMVTIDGYPVLCYDDTMTLFANPGMVRYRWSTGDTTETIDIIDEGTFSVWVRDSNGCRGLSDPIKITTPDTVAKYDVEGDLAFCEGDSVKFRARKGHMASYLWLPDSVLSRTIWFDTTGRYWLFTVDTFGCDAWSAPVDVYMQPNDIEKPSVEDTLICEYDFANLVASVNVGTLTWSEKPFGRSIAEGVHFQTPPLIEDNTYYVWSDYELCRGDTSAVQVYTMDCFNAFIPNIFTPNGDGNNEFFSIKLNQIQCFHLYVYNRWGVLLSESHDVEQGWDGTNQRTGEPVVEGTYYYLLEFCRHNGTNERLTGFLTLIRGN